MSKTPWYRDGLKFKCTGCGDCCTGDEGYVWVNKAEIAAMAAAIGEEDIERFEGLYVRKVGIRKSLKEYAGGDCVFFDNEARTCAVYKARPRQCGTWPFWQSNLRSEEIWEEIAEDCPGCNRGKLHSLEEIQKQMGAIRI